jgi:hypothetical protein
MRRGGWQVTDRLTVDLGERRCSRRHAPDDELFTSGEPVSLVWPLDGEALENINALEGCWRWLRGIRSRMMFAPTSRLVYRMEQAVSDDPVATLARVAAQELASQFGQPGLMADVEEALYARGEKRPPDRFVDPVALGSLVVSIAGLSWQVYRDRKKGESKPTHDTLIRIVRIRRRETSDLTSAEEQIIEVVAAKIIEVDGDDEQVPQERRASQIPSLSILPRTDTRASARCLAGLFSTSQLGMPALESARGDILRVRSRPGRFGIYVRPRIRGKAHVLWPWIRASRGG